MGSAASVPGKVVIIGAGLAGVALAKLLEQKGADVTVIERQEGFMYYAIAALRACVNEEVARQVLVPLDNLLQRGKLVIGSVVDITDSAVTLANGDVIDFDALVIATGTGARFPARPPAGATSRSQVIEAFDRTRDVISKANTIALVGGGAVGYELAGEICESFPGKNVHVFHAGKALLDAMPNPLTPATQTRLLQSLEAAGAHAHLGVTVDLGDIINEIDNQPAGNYSLPILDRTESGNPYVISAGDQEVAADAVILCVGNFKGSSEKLSESAWWKEHASEQAARLRVNQHLQVEGIAKGNVFCLGDAAFLPENQVGFLAQRAHAPVVAHNVIQVLQSRADESHTPNLKVYQPATGLATMVLPFGSRGGAGQIGSRTIGPWLTSLLKGGSLFLPKAYEAVNAELK